MASLPDKYRAVNIDDIVEIRPDISEDNAYPKLIIAKEFKRLAAERGDTTALVACTGKTYSWAEYYQNAHQFARALHAMNITQFDVFILINSCVHPSKFRAIINFKEAFDC